MRENLPAIQKGGLAAADSTKVLTGQGAAPRPPGSTGNTAVGVTMIQESIFDQGMAKRGGEDNTSYLHFLHLKQIKEESFLRND